MTSSIYEEAALFDFASEQQLAHIALNGTNIKAGATLAVSGRMRSFKLLEGNLRSHWNNYQTMRLQYNDDSFTVRIAALPAHVGATGFIEFLSVRPR